jgi:hypothetical protein
MRIRVIIAGVSCVAALGAPSALAVEAQPLPRRDGVVVAWQPTTTAAVVVTGDRRVYVIHTLRKVAPGTRVRVEGVKWGRPTAGIKWSVAPQGIKWGIKWAKNGTYQSRLTRTGTATTTSLRGTVIRRSARAVAVSVRGATIVIPTSRGAVWLPGGTRLNATDVGRLGTIVRVSIAFGPSGRAIARRITLVAPPSANAQIPVAGRVISVEPTTRSITVRAGTAALPVDIVLTVPSAIDLAVYPVGAQVAARFVQSANGTLSVTELSRNANFDQADSTAIAVNESRARGASAAAGAGAGNGPPPGAGNGPPPGAGNGPPPGAQRGGPKDTPLAAEVAAAAEDLRVRWDAARANGLIPGTGLFTANRNRLIRIGAWIGAGDAESATAELTSFVERLHEEPAGQIDPVFADEAECAAMALRTRLLED